MLAYRVLDGSAQHLWPVNTRVLWLMHAPTNITHTHDTTHTRHTHAHTHIHRLSVMESERLMCVRHRVLSRAQRNSVCVGACVCVCVCVCVLVHVCVCVCVC